MREHGPATRVDTETRALQFASYTFDMSFQEMFTTLTHGGCVCVPSEAERWNDLAGAMERLGVNWAKLTPTVVRLLHPEQVPSLRTLVVGGEPITQDIIQTWAHRVDLIVSYGPAEASIMAAVSDPLAPTALPRVIGRQVGGTLHVVDAGNHDRLVEGSGEGELLIEGPILATGYLKDQSRTDATFIIDPKWVSCDSENVTTAPRRFLKTGDLVHRDEDGVLYHLGRKDFRLKLNGRLIDLAAIETCLLGSAQIASAVVIATREDTFWQQSLVAVISAKPTPSSRPDPHDAGHIRIQTQHDLMLPLIRDLKDVAQSALPDYMVPTVWLVVDSVPRLPSGKIHRRRVVQWLENLDEFTVQEIRSMQNHTPHCEPETAMERRLRDIWAEVLNMPVSTVSTMASFTGLGGDSVAAMRLARRCAAQGLEVDVQMILQNLSITELAPRVKVAEHSTDTSADNERFSIGISLDQLCQSLPPRLRSSITLDDVVDTYRCSPMQEAILLSRSRFQGYYDVRWVAEVVSIDQDTPISLQRVRDAWVDVVRRHPALRTFFVQDASTGNRLLTQVILGSFPPLVSIDHSQATLDGIMGVNAAESSDPLHQEPHRLSLFSLPTGQVFLKLELNHALSDGVSTALIFRDLSLAYSKALPSSPAPSFGGFIRRLNLGEAEASSTALKYWTDRLTGMVPCLFPVLREAAWTGPSTVQHVEIPIHGSQGALRRFCTQHGTTIANVFQTAWALVLSIYTGTDDVSFCYLVSGRDASVDNVDEIVGPLISIMVHRLTLSRSLALLQVLRQVQSDFTVALGHQHCSLAQIAHSLNLRGQPMSNTVVNVQRRFSQGGPDGVADVYIRGIDCCNPTEFAIAVDVEDWETYMTARLSYWESCISQTQAEGIAETLAEVIRNIQTNPLQTVGEVALVGDAVLAKLSTWNAVLPEANEACLPELVERQVISQPSAVAIDTDAEQITYISLWNLSGLLAGRLIDSGVQPRDLVARAGGACVPLDPKAPAQRWWEIISRTGISTVVTSETKKHIMSRSGRVLPVLSVDSTAYVLFTSGSTGSPKGIDVPHRAICTSLCAHCPVLGITNETRSLQFAAYTFDASIEETFGAISWAFFTPSLVRLIDPDLVPSLQTIVLGGEAVGNDIFNTWSHRVDLINGYGPAEASICCAAAHLSLRQTQSPSTIGRAVGCRIWVVDPQNINRLLPPDCVGELLIEGHIVANGYWGDEERTASSFLSPPEFLQSLSLEYPADNFRRCFYRTGDLVRQRHDGSLIYVGRSDWQTKVNGQRVEIGEVEAQLSFHMAKNHSNHLSMVCVPKSGPWMKRLVAILSLDPEECTVGNRSNVVFCLDKPETAAMIRTISKGIESSLPPFMIPTVWIPVKQLPTLASGKINRRCVQEWVETSNEGIFLSVSRINSEAFGTSSTETTRGLTPTETVIRAIWSRVLNIPLHSIGLDNTFLSLGGDSISAMQVVYQAHREGLTISVQDIFHCKTVAKLGRHADHSSKNTSSSNLLAPPVDEVEVPFALSPIQQWFFESVPHKPAILNHYNQSAHFRVMKEIDHSQLFKALQHVVQRHAMLRSRFILDSWSWQQKITTDIEGSFRLEVESIDAITAFRSCCERAQKMIDIIHGPLLVAILVKVAEPAQHFLVLIGHHLSMDVVSWSIIHRELEAFLAGSQVIAPLSSTSFQQWARLHYEPNIVPAEPREVLPFSVLEADLDYWGMRDTANEYRHGEYITTSVDEETTASIFKEANIAIGTEPVELIMAAVLYSFGRIFHDRSLPALYMEAHGREGDEFGLDLSGTVGWFTTICPLQLHRESLHTWARAVAQVKDRRRSIPAKGWAYFACRTVSPKGQASFNHHQQMEILFNFTGSTGDINDEHDRFLSPVRLMEDSRSDFDPKTPRVALFAIEASVENRQLRFSVSYHRSMRHVPRVKQWIHSLPSTLQEGVQMLSTIGRQPTLYDCPLAALNYSDLDSILARIQQSQADMVVEEIYPCSHIQEGILLSSMRNPGHYQVRWLVKVEARRGLPVSTQRLAKAWQSVVRKHSILRTIFVDDPSGTSSFLQVVVEDPRYPASIVEVQHRDSVASLDEDIDFTVGELPYRATIYQLHDGNVFFLLDISHAILDGTSMGILAHELVRGYDGSLTGDEAPHYRDYIRLLQTMPRNETLAHWKAYLQDIEPCKMISRNNCVEKVITPEVRKVAVQLPSTESLQQFCKTYEVTFANILQAVWAVVLMHYSGSETVCFGYLSSGRDLPIPHVDRAVGPYINILPCAVRLQQSSSRLDVVKAIQADLYQNLAHEHCSLWQIHKELGLKGTTLFNTLVNFQKTTAAVEDASISLTTVASRDPSEYDLAFNVTDEGSSMTAELAFWSSFMDEPDANDLSRAVSRVFNEFVRSPEAVLHDLSPIGPLNVEQIVRLMPSAISGEQQCLHWLIEQWVCRTPDAPAVCSTELEWSYAKLHQLTTSLSHHLCQLGVGRNDRAAICMEKSPWVIVAMLAVLQAGAAFVPLDPSHPRTRRESMISSLDAQVLLISLDADEDAHLTMSSCRQVRVGSTRGAGSDTGVSSNLPKNEPDDAAYILFTSGSTGQPKGVVVPHRAVCSSIKAWSDMLNIRSTTRSLQFAAYTFDAAIGEIFAVLANGGCVCVPSESERLNFLHETITQLDVNWSFLTPSVIRQIDPSSVPTLQTLALGGEPLSKEVIETWCDRVHLINVYGPTETCVFSHANPITDSKQEPSLIGPPILGRSWVVSPFNIDILVPRGCIGELVIESPAVAAGYFNNPEQTAKAFIAPPRWWKLAQDALSGSNKLTEDELPRFYLTGDMVRQNVDGSITYLGRRDTQTKINGQRHAFVGVPKGGPYESRLVAVVSLRSEDGSGRGEAVLPEDFRLEVVEPQIAARYTSDLIVHLERNLPAYMVPAFLVVVRQLPLQPSGKINRRMILSWLSEPTMAGLQKTQHNFTRREEEPTTLGPVEKQMREIWSEVLNLPVTRIRLDQSFFDLGGGSITAMQVVSRCRRSGLQLTVQDLLRWKTITKVTPRTISLSQVTGERVYSLTSAGSVVDMRSIASKLEAIGLPGRAGVKGVYACSPMQEGILLAALKSPGKYEVVLMLEIRATGSQDRVDLELLESAWLQVVDRHDMLRTVFLQEKTATGVFSQVVYKHIDPPIEITTVDDLDTLRSASFSACHFDCIPYRVTLCKLSGSSLAYVRLDISHAVVDGWSLSILSRDLQQAYDGQLPSQPVAQYCELIQYLESQPQETSMEFWRHLLTGMVPCHLPNMISNSGSHSTQEVKLHQTRLEVDRNQELRDFCAAHDITIANVFQLAWAVVLYRYTGMEDVCFGYLISGRDAPIDNLEDAVGPFINILVARATLRQGISVKEFLGEIRDTFLAMSAHQHTSLTQIQHELAVGNLGLFNTALNVQHRALTQQNPHSDIEICELSGRDPSEFGAILNVIDAGNTLEFALSYWSDLLSEETGREICSFLSCILSAVLDNSGCSVKTVSQTAADAARSFIDRKGDDDISSTPRGNPAPECYRPLKEPTNLIALTVQQVCAEVLDLSVSSLSLDETFLSLGGDSLLAMKVVSRCREHGVALTVQHMLQNQTIREVFEHARFSDSFSYRQLRHTPDPTGIPFPLSPIQKLHFHLMPTGQNYYNQSFFLRVTERLEASAIERAVRLLVLRHSVLRARFNQQIDGAWAQVISPDIEGSYHFSATSLISWDGLWPLVEGAQKRLNIRQGPLLSVDVLNLQGGDQHIYLVGHHLVVDLVSWRIILADLEIILRGGELSHDPPLSFQTWIRLATEYAQDNIDPATTLPFQLRPGNFAYWGMAGIPNLAKDVSSLSITLPTDITSSLLGPANASLGTEPTDLMIAALAHTFSLVFHDHSGLTIFQESHGREPWTPEIDLSATCGWFTVLTPLSVETDKVEFRNTLKRVKDLRRRIPGKGWPYFASRFASRRRTGQKLDEKDEIEVLFNFVGLYQQFNRNDSLFVRPVADVSLPPDFSPDSIRLALIEINSLVDGQGRMVMHVTYNSRMKRQEGLTAWLERSQQVLEEEMPKLLTAAPERTPSDFQLLSLSYNELSALESHCHKQFGLDLNAVEDIYPCSPMQEGILLSQVRDPSLYRVEWVADVRCVGGEAVDLGRLKQAWGQVVRRHPILRTIFVERDHDAGAYLQLVLNQSLFPSSCNSASAYKVLLHLPYHITFQCLPETDTVRITLQANHAIIDGVTLAILAPDLGSAYGGELPDVSGPPFSDFVKFLRTRTIDKDLQYWSEFLSDSQPTLFPSLGSQLGPTPGAEDDLFVEKHIHFADGAKMHEFCATFGVTVLNLFQVAWALVLRLYTGQDDVCFGYLASGRDSNVSGIDDIAGPMINMLVCRLQPTRDKTPRELLKQAHKHLTLALSHQHVPLAEVQNRLRTHGTPLFNTLVNLQKSNVGQGISHLTISTIGANDPNEFTIGLQIADNGQSIDVLFGHWLSRVSVDQADLLASLLSSTVNNIMARPRARLGTINFCNGVHAQKMAEWNEQARRPVVESTLHSIIQDQARQRPSTIAIASTEAMWTYEELERAADQTARYLLRQGVQPGTILPFCMAKSPRAIVVMLAILKVGCACAALDPAHPPDRLKLIVQQTGAKFVISEPVVMDSLILDGTANILSLTDCGGSINEPGLTPCQLPSVKPTDIAFIMFTSGSTGTPKGVLIQHESICTSIQYNGEAEMVTSSTRGLQFSSYAFDTSVDEIFTVLSRGGCVCVPTEAERMNHLAAFISRFDVNWLSITPTVARLIAPGEVPSVRTIVLGGEEIDPGVVNHWKDHAELVASYGPAEASIACAASPVTSVVGDALLGRPVASSLWVVDPSDHDALMPIGTAGELVIGGPLVARGYLNDPDRTSLAFVCPKWSTELNLPFNRFYRTGDMARWNVDGTLSYVGRLDTQVKLNGQRVELGEVERHLLAQPCLQCSTCAVPQSGLLANRLVGVIGLQTPQISAADEFHCLEISQARTLVPYASDAEESLRAKLPPYMVPTVWIGVQSLPLNASGKLDRRKVNKWLETFQDEDTLNIFQLVGSEQEAEDEPPLTPIQQTIRNIWADVLGRTSESIGLQRSFFALGGDSVAAIRVVAQCRQANLQLTVQDVFQARTIQSLAACATAIIEKPMETVSSLLEPSQCENPESELAKLDSEVLSGLGGPENIEEIYPCSPMQEGILFSRSSIGGSYDTRLVVEVLPRDGGEVDLDRLKNAWAAVVRRHPILRTVFADRPSDDSAFIQVTFRKYRPVIMGCETSEQSLDDMIAMPVQPFDDRRNPPHRFTVCTSSQRRVFILLEISHVLTDAVSIDIIWRDLQLAYEGALTTSKAPRYSRFVSYLQGTSQKDHMAYWLKFLKDAEPCFFPHLGTGNQKGATRAVSVTISRAMTDHIRQFCASLQITVANLIQVMWSMVLRSYTGMDDVSFGYITSGRDLPLDGIDDLVGPLISMMISRVRYTPSMKVADVIKQVGQDTVASMAHQHCSLAAIHREVGLKSRSLFNTVLTVVRPHSTQSIDSSLQLTQIASSAGTSEFDVVLEVSDSGVELDTTLAYSESALRSEDATNLSQAIV
ncbi:Nonribosomal peptide synthetase 8, partial [Aspergillus fumigatus]